MTFISGRLGNQSEDRPLIDYDARESGIVRVRFWIGIGGRFRIEELGGTVEEGHDLSAGTGIRRGELGLGRAVGDVVFHGPEDGLVEIVALADVLEGILLGFRFGGALCAPEEGHDLAAGAVLRRRELRLGRAGGDPLLHGPENGLEGVARLVHVGEGVLR